jgi:aerobic-type carbon monoxide dehydrogenase small subunit (CoxS/CutS family)
VPRLTVNNRPVEFRLDPQTPLLWALRDAANLTGTKYGCGKRRLRRLHGAGRWARRCARA